MTPPDATAHRRTARGGTHRGAPSRPPRRASGPARPARSVRAGIPIPAAAGAGAGVAAPPLALRLARAGARIGDARVLDRLVRGRGWIALVAVGLMGIVFMQVSMLRLNAGISRAVTAADTLERQNSTLRGEISRLDAGERIQSNATALGMVRPPAGEVNYLDARKADGRAAATAIRAPNPVKVTGTATTTDGSATPAATTQPQPQAQAQAQAAAPAPAQTEAQAAAAPAQAPAATTAPAQATTAPTTTAPAQTQAQPPPQSQSQAPAATTATTQGAP